MTGHREQIKWAKQRNCGTNSEQVWKILKFHAKKIQFKVWRKKNQQDATVKCLLLTFISSCFGHHYAHFQENKEPVTAFGVLFWFCWMWLVAVVGRCLEGSEHYEGFCFCCSRTGTFIVLTSCKTAPPQPLPTTSSRTRTIHQMQ